MEPIKVQTSQGEIELRKPKAKHFAKAMENAEISNGEIKMTKLFNELLPYCIEKHPFGQIKVKDGIGELDPEDYVKLFNEIKNLINISGDDTGK